jgi:hypothetical protein
VANRVYLKLDAYAKTRCHRIKSIQQYCKAGMPHIYEGRNIIIDTDDADRWIKQNYGRGYIDNKNTKSYYSIGEEIESVIRSKAKTKGN